LVRWCRRNLPFADFGINHLDPPLPYEEEQFDLIYALSGFYSPSRATADIMDSRALADP
jgi:hypothetical protein